MKKFILIIIAFFFFISLLTSCKKNKSTGPERIDKIKTLTSNAGTPNQSTANYLYDAEGRLIESNSSNSQAKNTYTYLPGKVLQKYTDASGNITNYEYTLGANGYFTKLTAPTFTWQFEISNNGFVQKTTTVSGGDVNVETLYYNGDDILDSTITTFNGAYTGTTYFTNYITDKKFVMAKNYGRAFMGEFFKNPYRNVMVRNLHNGVVTTESFTYSYEFDGIGRTTKATIRRSDGTTGVTLYTYY